MAVTPTNWNRLKEIVADAIDAPADERAALVAAACDHDDELAAEAHKLIDAYGDVDGVVLNRDTDGWLGIGGPDVLSLGGQRIGRYRLVRVLGEGAMSAVYLARQANPDRDVAVKLLRTALPLVDARGRFRREATALARLRHPNIAVIYEAGLQDTDDNRAIPFIAMEYIDGVSLTEYCKAHHLDREARIKLVIEIAGAVQHAHQQTIIHRDLKPANVLVDASGTPKVLDFGIARIAAVDSERTTWQTTAGLLLGTPGYMSPEQCAPDASHGVDVRTDVWSLGVMLYELLLGRLPIEARGGNIADVMRRLESSEPTPPHVIDPALRGDLETILMTAVCRDKERRYASAQAFADDLGRYLKQLPIEAHPPTTFYLASKFVRRNRGVIAAAAAAAIALLASTIISSAGFYNANRERDRATDALNRAVASEAKARFSEQAAQQSRDLAVGSERRSQAVRDFLVEMIGSPDPVSGRRDITVLDMLKYNEDLMEKRFADDPLTAAELFSTVGWTYFNLSDYEAAERNTRKAVERFTAALGADAVKTIDDRCRLVTILRWKGDSKAAKVICDAALADALRTLGPDHASTFPLLDNDAGISEDLGDVNESIEKYRRVYETGIRVFGPQEDQVLTAGNNLGLALLNVGRYSESERVLREVVQRADQLRGQDSVRALTPRQNLATALLYLNRVEEAAAILESAVATAERELQPTHRTLRAVLLSLADARRQLGRFDEAIELLHRVAAFGTAADGRSHSSTIYARIGLMSTLSEAGRTEEATVVGRAALADCVADGVEDEPYVWGLRQNLAAVLNEPATAHEAEPMIRACHDRLRKMDGERASTTLIAACNLAGTLVTVGKLDEAAAVANDALGKVSQDHELITASLHRVLARAAMAAGHYDESKAQLDIAWTIFQGIPNPYYKRRAIEMYIELADKRGDPASAAAWRQQRDENAASRATSATTSPSTTGPASPATAR